MTKIIFVRHGQTEWNVLGRYQGQTDIALSPLGIEQAEKLAAHFPVDKVEAVYSSDLVRAMTTARCVADLFGLTVEPRPELRELNFGDWEGLTYDEIVAKWPDALNNFFQHPDVLEIPHGESFPKLRERALDAVEKIVACHPNQTVAVFAHGAILRTILTAALHMDLKYVWTIRQFNTAVNIVTYTEHGTTVELLNGTGHLKYAQGTVD
ncbi:histidine phosphatase family protein [Mitsuokella jalaludinii]|uniref:histidine phosphatase family protein n=1 Tax=Mitsuokella jalaludinii TaxID=187979 RepID=UPI00242B0E4B|nr:histidine phosphatase family protein [Mitsuokella jalaludinii]MCI6612262.1 histidine phosphatase family protein [Mitsuokella jalaludinii]MDY5364908.1 histidine phosphatase family protein [Mitsuokella jalaludinii]